MSKIEIIAEESVQDDGYKLPMPNGHDANKAYQEYPDEKYQNKVGKVFPLAILYVDHINDIMTMTPEQIATYVETNIVQLNNRFGSSDDSYSYYSNDKIRETGYNIRKCKNLDQVLNYLTNIYFKGKGLGGSWKKANRIEGRILLKSIF